ncbi:oxidoreductase [Fragilaria crotonensis]|nr:oxidoreductase [Fragilaria crotonensis]
MRINLTSGTDGGGLGWRCSVEKAGGGLVIDGGLHWIRPLREICGDVERVVGVTRTHVAPELEMEGETLAHAIFQFKAPCTAVTVTPTASSEVQDNATSASTF